MALSLLVVIFVIQFIWTLYNSGIIGIFAYFTLARIHLILVSNICVIVLNYALPPRHIPLSPSRCRLLVVSVCLEDTLVAQTPLLAVSLRIPFSLKNGLHKQAVTLLLLYVLYHDNSHDLSHGSSRGLFHALSLGPSLDTGHDLVDLFPAYSCVWRSIPRVLVDCLLGV